VSLAVLLAAFGVATLLCRPLLRTSRLQARVGAVAAVHAAVAVPVLAALSAWTDASLPGCLLLWLGAGLTWFVVCSHLESSVLLAMLEDLAAGPLEGGELLRRYDARYGFAARIGELAKAGLIEAPDAPSVTRKGRLVLASFGWLGGPTGAALRPAAPSSGSTGPAAAGRRA
jgi:hypothetical protein